MIGVMEPQAVHISDAELIRDVRSLLKRVETGDEIIIERNAQPMPCFAPMSRAPGNGEGCFARR